MYQIICIGSGSKDVFFPTSEMIILDNPTHDITAKKLMAFEYGAKIRIDDRYEAPGGCAANASQGLARLGIDVACYCRIGRDGEGEWVRKNLEEEGVSTELIQEDEQCKTDLAVILVNAEDGERTIFVNRDANENLEIIPENIDSEWMFVSSLNGDVAGNLAKLGAIIREKGNRAAFNPGQNNISKEKESVLDFIKITEILIVNRDEATEIVGKDSDEPLFLLNELHQLGPKIAIITDGKEGAWVSDGKAIIKASGTIEDPVDLTGAGDAFSAAFLAAHIKGINLSECLRWGIANGGNVVNFYGAKEGLFAEEEIVKKAKRVEVISV